MKAKSVTPGVLAKPVTLATEFACELAENPLWSSENNCLYWTDIPAGRIYRLDLSSGRHQIIYEGTPVGGFTLQHNGELLLFRVDDIALLRADGSVWIQQRILDQGMVRFNDVIADPAGRVFAGTIGKSAQSGGLYRLDRCGRLNKLFTGTGCSNGMGFAPDRRTFYWTCSTTSQVFAFPYDATSGELGARKLFYAAQSDEGIPDGLTVDAEGCVWSARWGASCVVRHGPDGSVIGGIPLPVPQISSLCFAGDLLDRLVITSAQQIGVFNSGCLFQTFVSVHGKKEFTSNIVARH